MIEVTNYKKPPRTNSVIDGGKLQPQATELEEAVLGAMMLEKNAVSEAIEILKPESFYKEAHQYIFKAILRLFNRGEPVDILTVSNELRTAGEIDLCGGVYFVSQLTNRVASAANIQAHARIIQQKFISRELISVGTNAVRDGYDETVDCFKAVENAELGIYQISQGNVKKDFKHLSLITSESKAQMIAAGKREDGLSGVPSGFRLLDRLTGGWQRSDLIILAARPGMGKSSVVFSMARNIAGEFDRPVALFSLEMSSVQLANRLISIETGITGEEIRRGKFTEQEHALIDYKIQELNKAPIYIDDTPALSIFELRAKARRLKAKHQIELIVIDYLQLMTAGGEHKGNREQEISMISRSLKGLAKELDIPVIALSQLNRSCETRGGDKRPMLADLRESGAIEQDADLVAFVYRPEYYGIVAYEDGNSAVGVAEIIVAKHRNGALDSVKLHFEAKTTKFSDLDITREYMKSEVSRPVDEVSGFGMQPNTEFEPF